MIIFEEIDSIDLGVFPPSSLKNALISSPPASSSQLLPPPPCLLYVLSMSPITQIINMDWLLFGAVGECYNNGNNNNNNPSSSSHCSSFSYYRNCSFATTNKPPSAVCFSKFGGTYLVEAFTQTIIITNLKTQTMVKSFRVRYDVKCCDLYEEESKSLLILALGGPRGVQLQKIMLDNNNNNYNLQVPISLVQPYEICQVEFSLDGKYLIVGASTCDCGVWEVGKIFENDELNAKWQVTLPTVGGNGILTTLHFLKNKWFYSSTWQKEIHTMYELENRLPLYKCEEGGTINNNDNATPCFSVFCLEENVLVTSSSRLVKIYENQPTNDKIAPLPPLLRHCLEFPHEITGLALCYLGGSGDSNDDVIKIVLVTLDVMGTLKIFAFKQCDGESQQQLLPGGPFWIPAATSTMGLVGFQQKLFLSEKNAFFIDEVIWEPYSNECSFRVWFQSKGKQVKTFESKQKLHLDDQVNFHCKAKVGKIRIKLKQCIFLGDGSSLEDFILVFQCMFSTKFQYHYFAKGDYWKYVRV